MNFQELTQFQLNAMRNWVLGCSVDEEDFDYIESFATDHEIYTYVNKHYNGGVTSFLKEVK